MQLRGCTSPVPRPQVGSPGRLVLQNEYAAKRLEVGPYRVVRKRRLVVPASVFGQGRGTRFGRDVPRQAGDQAIDSGGIVSRQIGVLQVDMGDLGQVVTHRATLGSGRYLTEPGPS